MFCDRTTAETLLRSNTERPLKMQSLGNNQAVPCLQKRAQLQLILTSVNGGRNEKLKQLLNEYRDVFVNNENEVGLTNRTQFRINSKSKVPFAEKLRRTPFALRAEVDKQIKDMEQRGIIKKSTRPTHLQY